MHIVVVRIFSSYLFRSEGGLDEDRGDPRRRQSLRSTGQTRLRVRGGCLSEAEHQTTAATRHRRGEFIKQQQQQYRREEAVAPPRNALLMFPAGGIECNIPMVEMRTSDPPPSEKEVATVPNEVKEIVVDNSSLLKNKPVNFQGHSNILPCIWKMVVFSFRNFS